MTNSIGNRNGTGTLTNNTGGAIVEVITDTQLAAMVYNVLRVLVGLFYVAVVIYFGKTIN